MVRVIYDGSWAGFLTAVFDVYDRRLEKIKIIREALYHPDAFSETLQITTDHNKAGRVWQGLLKKLPQSSCKDIYSCYLSELPEIESTMLQFIRLAFLMDEAEKAYGTPAVLKVSQVSKMVHREKHRMEAFVRFKLTKDDIYFAEIDPDFNVLPLILNHFKKRYANQKWLIYDLKRKYGIYYDLDKVEEVTLDLKPETLSSGRSTTVFQENEELYQALWKDYFQSVNITERKNIKLHVQHVPKRYWKYLIEKKL